MVRLILCPKYPKQFHSGLTLQRAIDNPEVVVPRTFWMGPMENWDHIVKNNLESFMIKFLLARNVMLIFTVFICIAKVISEITG